MVIKTNTKKYKPLLVSDDLNGIIGKEVFIYVEKINDSTVNYVACERLPELSEYIVEYGLGAKRERTEDAMVIRGTICNAYLLPFESPENWMVYVIFNDTEIYRYDSMELATMKIESLIKVSDESDLTDIVVVVGKQMQPAVKNSILAKARAAQLHSKCLCTL